MLGLHNGRITASIRQVVNSDIISDISSIEIGHTVEGSVSEIHKDNAVLILQPSHVRALLSLKNLANHRGLTLPQLRIGLKVGENLEELVVVTRNAEKAFVIVANKPKPKPAPLLRGSAITMESVEVGQLVGGRVTRHTRRGALIKITTNIGGILHATDTSDSFEPGISLPGIDAIIKATIIEIDKTKRQLTLSTRQSRMRPSPDQVIADREISGIEDIQVGETLRGFIKNIGEHGLFVTIARDVDARVQIRELFDEVLSSYAMAFEYLTPSLWQYIKDWQGQFHVNQLVKGRLLRCVFKMHCIREILIRRTSVDISSKKVEMTLRSGDPLTRRESSGIFVSDLKEGQKVEGVVKKIEDYGLFIQINESKINGLCHKSQVRLFSTQLLLSFDFFFQSSLIMSTLMSPRHFGGSAKVIA
jgi:rRNA biogenesis protein RRP5